MVMAWSVDRLGRSLSGLLEFLKDLQDRRIDLYLHKQAVDTTTTAGLPKRTPMAQLVPGGVDRGGNPAQKRTPEGVRGLLSAYHRGVQRGRTKEQSTNPEETPGGQQSSQAGKEHEA